MKHIALILSLAALTGCAGRYTHPMAVNNWAAVQWLPRGTEVAVVRAQGKQTGTVEAVSSDRIVVRGKGDAVSIERSEILRVTKREACRNQRKSNTITSGIVFSLAAALLLPFHGANDAKLFGVMTAGGIALGATTPTTTYRESDIYVRR